MTVAVAPPPVKTGLGIEANLLNKLHLADIRNHVPVIQSLGLYNETDQVFEQVTLALACDPPFLKSRNWHLDQLPARSSYPVSDVHVGLEGNKLARLTEAEIVVVTLTLSGMQTGACDKHVLAGQEYRLELLPRNHWRGLDYRPEMIAAFVQPNDPAIARILKKVSSALQDAGKNPSIDGYAGGPRRVYEMVSAIWTAVASMQLTYTLPPASFEQTGQKVRSPTQIELSGMGTCLDLSLLFCAVLEQAGLSPLVVFSEGHSWVGVWLRPDEFSSMVAEDISALRNRVLLDDILLLESTLVAQPPVPSFTHAIEQGKRQIEDGQEKAFVLAVDVKRARMLRIQPLASDDDLIAQAVPSDGALARHAALPAIEDAPATLADEFHKETSGQVPGKPQDKLEFWQSKLLDMTLRNPLLHLGDNRTAVKLEAPDPQALEHRLADGKKPLKLRPRPALMEGDDPRNRVVYEAQEREDVRRKYALDALKRDEVLVNANDDKMETRLLALYRDSRTVLQEGGANTLYLALGFLSWTRADREDRPCRAPLILVPVTLQRKSARSGFTLSAHEDEPIFNTTLVEYLRRDCQLSLNVGELKRDANGLDIAAVWRKVGHAIKDIKGWQIQEDVVLAQFSFAKYLMWKDLAQQGEALRENPVVRHLLDTQHEPYGSKVEFPEPRQLDREFDPKQLFCPLPLDSSQLAAVMAASRGKDFVLIGPPGTGKSQTIANMIAQSLAEKRRVLFVAEKIAALDVVYRRLKAVGLGEFCLQLHSNKARKTDVLAQLQQTWESRGKDNAGQQWHAEAERLKQLRDDLNQYARRLHHRHPNGWSLFTAIGIVSNGQGLPQLNLHWPSPDTHDEAGMQQLRDAVERLQVNASNTGQAELSTHPLALIGHRNYTPTWARQLMAAARDLVPSVQAMLDAAHTLAQHLGFDVEELTPARCDGLALLAEHLPAAFGHADWGFILRPNAHQISQRLLEGAALLREYAALEIPLSAPWAGISAHLVERERDDLNAKDPLYTSLGEAWRTATQAQFQQNLDLLTQLTDHAGKLALSYGSRIEQLDTEQLQQQWEQAGQFIWPKSWLNQRKIKKQLRGTTNPDRRSNNQFDVAKELEHLNQIRVLREQIEERSDEIEDSLTAPDALRDLAPGLWRGMKTSPDEIEAACQFQAKLSAAIAKLATTPARISDIKTGLQPMFGEANLLLAADGLITQACVQYLDTARQLYGKRESVVELGQLDENAQNTWHSWSLDTLLERSQAIVQSEHDLQHWCVWRDTRHQAIVQGLAPLVDALEQGTMACQQTKDAFEVAYARWWFNAVVEHEPVIRQFSGAEHEQRIENFRQVDERFTELTRDWLRARLCAKLPKFDGAKRSSEWGILRHEMQKKRRQMALRELLDKVPTAFSTLTPCLLMSPLSIAQYLSANSTRFDLVIFDEASQIPPWEAIGAMARARQVVMVGDPKQLPPTNFFARSQQAQDDDDGLDDGTESILDQCRSACLPEIDLNWHYRSRHEALIAFSNHRYYDARLVTFPSPVTHDRAVSLHLVSGTHTKGSDRTNQNEAKAVVADIVKRLLSPDFRKQKLTIGVVTFNANQQKLIEDLLDKARRDHPEIEPDFSDDLSEPVFVKNLESVQGDERDIIYFSLTYGPDPSGRLLLSAFQQLTRTGGERRLNVAITRARHEMRVFSSFHPDQLDLSRSAAQGVRDLKHFLEFAKHGARALFESNQGSIGSFESPFETAVARALEQRGWRVEPQIGVSRFRIDLGIVNPDAQGRYLAGVECDGATYHSNATARDRDKLREQVLRGLGWEIVRVWSTSWWYNPARTLEKLDEQLHILLKTWRSQQPGQTAEAGTVDATQESGAAGPESFVKQESPVEDIAKDHASDPAPTINEKNKAPPKPGRRQRANPQKPAQADIFADSPHPLPKAQKTPVKRIASTPYLASDPVKAVSMIDPKSFMEDSYTETLDDMINHVIEQEGPISGGRVILRIARAHGWDVPRTRFRNRIWQMLWRDYRQYSTHEEVGRFYWPTHLDPGELPPFRLPGNKNSIRKAKHICLPELVSLAHEMIALKLQGECALQKMAQQMGFASVPPNDHHRLQKALRLALSG